MEDIICPQCNDAIKAGDRWDFMDGEKHKITCVCGYQFVVIIERPIEYYIPESAQGKMAASNFLKIETLRIYDIEKDNKRIRYQ